MVRGKRLVAAATEDQEIVDLHQIALWEAGKILSMSAGDAIEDIAQASVLEYHTYAAKQEVGNPGGLVRIIARRKSWRMMGQWRDRYDDVVAEAEAFGDDEDDAPAGRARVVETRELIADDGDPWVSIEAMKTDELVRFAIAQLDDRDREIIELTYLHDPPLKAPEVAQRLGMADGTVRNHLVGIRRELRMLLTEDPWFDHD